MSGAEIIILPVIARREAADAACVFNTPAALRRAGDGADRIRDIARRTSARTMRRAYRNLERLCSEIADAASLAIEGANDPGEIDTLLSLKECYLEDRRHYGVLADRYAGIANGTASQTDGPVSRSSGAAPDIPNSPGDAGAAPNDIPAQDSGPAHNSPSPDDGPPQSRGKRPDSCGAASRPSEPTGGAA